MSESLANFFALINDVLQAAIVIFGMGAILYNLPYWRRERVTRAFSNLIFFVVIVYFTELLASRTELSIYADFFLRLGWVGIALVPASQFHLSDALMVTIGHFSPKRHLGVRILYLISIVILVMVFTTNWLVGDLFSIPRVPHLLAGRFFFLFLVYFWGVVFAGIYNVYRARQHCVTRTTARRMTVILMAFLAAPLGVFPYQLFSHRGQIILPIWLLLIVGNLVVGVMFAVLTMHLSYFGRVSPDRVVRVRLFKFMARVPLAGTLALIVYTLVGRASPLLGLPKETMQAIALVATIMIVEWILHQFRRPLERLFQLNDEPEVRRIQQLSERILTTRDLHQFLESILTATCDTLRSPTAFIASITPQGPQLEVVVGQLRAPEDLWDVDWQDDEITAFVSLETVSDFVIWENYWIRPLYDQHSEKMLGVLGIEGRTPEPHLTKQEEKIFARLLEQASGALADRLLQQEVFLAVEGLLPNITVRQRQRSAATYGTASQLTESLIKDSTIDPTIVDDPAFTKMVRDALKHFWGGPNLADSPLLKLSVVQEAMNKHGDNATKALREILQNAIEQQRPDGERRLTTAEWILYNILELKFIQGKKVRDIALRLAMSESDLYRKQRVAVENVARALLQMERQTLSENQTESH